MQDSVGLGVASNWHRANHALGRSLEDPDAHPSGQRLAALLVEGCLDLLYAIGGLGHRPPPGFRP